jgi:hypothetical protein
MSPDVELKVIANIKQAIFLATKLDESTDVTGKAQRLTFSEVVCNGDVTEQFLFCKPLSGTTFISVLTICHGNHASAPARAVLPLLSHCPCKITLESFFHTAFRAQISPHFKISST